MSYLTQDAIASNKTMQSRVAQCAAQEGVGSYGSHMGIGAPTTSVAAMDPDQWSLAYRRTWSSAPDWDDAWEYALAANPDLEDPGADPGVITDGMILSQVQSMLAVEPAP